MARKVSKRKRPLKEDFQLKERLKVESEVFDKTSLMDLSKLMKKGLIQTVDYPISTGKEANVFRATTEDGSFIAIKIYKIETSHFFRRKEYLEGDPRFTRIKMSEKEIVKAFARKEFKNLEICERAGVHSPKPYYIRNNIIVMEFLGEGELPYPTMGMLGPKNPEKELKSILADVKKMYKAGLVHADLSEYNILNGKVPQLIDFSEGVVLGHPSAGKFLERDVRNVLKFFSKYGVKKDLEKVLKWIRS
jgi:RIO kinase 1